MAKRKPTDYAQMNLRLRETLRKQIEVEAKKNGWSLNSELVRRLERSFINQSVEALIQQAVAAMATEVRKDLIDHMANINEHFDEVAKALGRPDLVANLKKGEGSNG
jgi:hypothetical protein